MYKRNLLKEFVDTHIPEFGVVWNNKWHDTRCVLTRDGLQPLDGVNDDSDIKRARKDNTLKNRLRFFLPKIKRTNVSDNEIDEWVASYNKNTSRYKYIRSL